MRWWTNVREGVREGAALAATAARGLWGAFANASPRAQLLVIGLLLGIPTTCYGLVWHQFKPVKEATDCYVDTHLNMVAAFDDPMLSPEARVHAMAEAGNPMGCIAAVDPNRATTDFLKQQYERYRRGRP